MNDASSGDLNRRKKALVWWCCMTYKRKASIAVSRPTVVICGTF